MLPAQPNQSLIDGLACLGALASASSSVGVRELGRRLELEPTRVNRLLKTLAHLGLAEQDAERRYRPGPGIHVLAAQAMFGSGLIRRATAHLEALRRFGGVVALGVLWRESVCYLYHAEPHTPTGEALGRVALYPAIRSGVGCALLATEPNNAVRARLAKHHDKPAIDELLGRLAQYRKDGLANVDQGTPTNPHHHSYGVAIGQRPSAAIAISGTFDKQTESQVINALRDAAAAIDQATEKGS